MCTSEKKEYAVLTQVMKWKPRGTGPKTKRKHQVVIDINNLRIIKIGRKKLMIRENGRYDTQLGKRKKTSKIRCGMTHHIHYKLNGSVAQESSDERLQFRQEFKTLCAYARARVCVAINRIRLRDLSR